MAKLHLKAAGARFVGALASIGWLPMAAASVEPLPMTPGLWETVVASETPGVDLKKTMTAQVCFVAENFRSTQQVLPRQADFGAKCTVKDYKYAKNTASWNLSCTTKLGTLQGPGTINYTATGYSGTAALVSKEGGKSAKVNQTFTGKRLSDCK
jgi:hypothetical protein